MRVADVILKVLERHGVKHIFGMPGDAINDITDALRRQDTIRFVGVRHEEAGAFAASAQAKLTGELTACMGTSGPGAIHLLNGLYDAKMDHAPVIAITGQVATDFIGTSYHQEVDLERLFGDVALYSQTVTTTGQLPAVIQEACRAAITGRGVAHISIPTDLAGRKTSVKDDEIVVAAKPGLVRPSFDDCKAAIDILDAAEKVAILAGIGCADAVEELKALAQKLDAPIIRTLRAKDIIDDDPLCIGGIGLLGSEPAVAALDQCDALLMVGTDFPYVDFYPSSAKSIQIDLFATQIGKRHPVDVGLVGHAGPAMAEIHKHVRDRPNGTFLSESQNRMTQWLDDQRSAETSDAKPIKPQRLLYDIAAVAPDNAIYLCDTGTATAWSARHLRLKSGQRYTLSSAHASMAFALPGAIGAQLAFPGRPVIAIAGDGGFTMLMGDFVTAVREDLPVVIVILNNGKLGFIALEQLAKGLPEHSIELTNPDFAAFAESCGGMGYRVFEPDQIRPTLQQALREKKPAIVDVHVAPDELIMPPRIEWSKALNFAYAKIREAIE